MRTFLALGLVSLWICACSNVRVTEDDPAGAGGTGGSPDGGGGQAGAAPVCTPLPGPNEFGCIERNNPIASVEAAIDGENYLSFLALGRDVGLSGYTCASGEVTLGGTLIEAAPFPSWSCFRLQADEWLSTMEVAGLPEELLIDPNLSERSAKLDRTLVSLAPGSSYQGFNATDLPLLGVFSADGQLPWMRPLYTGTAIDNFSAFEHSLLLSNGDVAVSLILGQSNGGSVDFGSGFSFTDSGQGRTAYIARLDGETGATLAAFALEVEDNASELIPLDGKDGSFTALVMGAPEGSTEWWVRWYDLDGAEAKLLAEIDEASPGSTAEVDAQGRLWFNQWEGDAGVRMVDREGNCSTVSFDGGPPFYALDLKLLPSGNPALLLSVYGERQLDGCSLADVEGDGELFAAELSSEGDWVRVVRLSRAMPQGSMLLDATENDLVVFYYELDENGIEHQRIERIDWGEAAF